MIDIGPRESGLRQVCPVCNDLGVHLVRERGQMGYFLRQTACTCPAGAAVQRLLPDPAAVPYPPGGIVSSGAK